MKYRIENVDSYSSDFYRDVYSELNDYQRTKIDRLRYDEDKKLSLLGLYLVKKLTNVPIKDIFYDDKKPLIPSGYISISHKYPYVGVIASSKRVGIDLEILKDIPRETVHYLKAHDTLDALIIWTKKESLFKASLKTNFCFKTLIIANELIMTICRETS